ncbi:MAG: HAMP domain-containing histidine kinase [Xanthomonadaceae bacterium]|nr:HAMP domain-containing histidine kinase [Xanthomonadaceae bacterium]
MNSASAPVIPFEDDPTAEAPSMQAGEDVAALRARIQTLEDTIARMCAVQAAMAHGISHDVRAPLRAIDSFAAQLARELDADEAAGQQVAKIRAAATRLGYLTESLLEYSRMTRAELQPGHVDIGFLIDWSLMDLRGQHPETRVEADVQPDLQAWGDERLLRILFDKLLDNSRKFAKPGDAAHVRIRGEREGDALHLTVADAGIGMRLRDAEQPFEPFMRLHGNREGAGDGLGLAIAQAIVHRHGGRIWMASQPDQGSQVHVVLPGPDAG